jgi:CHAT domain-containing protein
MEAQTQELCTELGRLSDEPSKQAFLERTPQLLETAVVAALAEAVRRQLRVDLPEALLLAEAALAIALQLKDDESIGLSLRAKANVLWFMGQCKQAVELYREAVKRFEAVGNLSEVARTWSTSIQSFALLGEYSNAAQAAARAREIFNQLGDTLREARLDINVANIYHRQNHFAEALAAYKRAYEQLLPHNDSEAAGVVLHNIAVCLIALDDFPGALDTFHQMRDFCRRQDMPLLESQADYNIAYLFSLRGEYAQALELLRSSRETCRKNNDKYHLALCDLDQSEIYLELGLVDEAAEMARKALDQFQELEMNYEKVKSLANLAVASGMRGDSTGSRELFAKAKEIVAAEKNQVWPSLLDLYQALMLFNEGNLSEARRLGHDALTFFSVSEIPSKHVLSQLLLARILLKSGELDEALRHCQTAIESLSKLEATPLCYQSHFVIGQVHEARGDLQQAYDSYQASREALNTLRSGLHTEELKISFMKNRMEVYARLVDLCLQRDSTPSTHQEAFAYVEEAKSRTLRDLIFARVPSVAAGFGNTETAKRIAELRKELNWCYRRIEREQLSQEGAAPEVIASIQTRARAQERQLLSLERESSPFDTPKTLRASDAVSLAQIRKSLGPDTSLIEYFYIGDRVFAAVLTAKTLDFVELTTVTGIAQKLRMLQFQMSKFHLGRDYISRFHDALLRSTLEHLRSIYDELLAPLRGMLNTRHLVVVPYGPLHSLPFHTLFDGQHFLIDHFTISYAPSAGIYAFYQGQNRTPNGPSLILGVEDLKTPFIRQEVEAVAAVVPNAKVLLGSDANESALREYGARCRLIHVATHGYFREDSPMFSSIRLADSYLSLYDLYHMDLTADLLTLSGCVTGLSVIAEGDELIGLARGLLYAGARSLLLSLWDVDDSSTAELMKTFYSCLFQGQNKAEALRSAMLNLRERRPHPYYWAPFRLVGNSLS